MPRVHTVKKARGIAGNCGKCGKILRKGQPYIHWAFFRSGKRVRCNALACRPLPSELTQSKYKGPAYAAQEEVQRRVGDCTTVNELESLRDDAAQMVEDIVDEFEESLSNIEAGCGHTESSVYQDLESRREEYEAWKDEIESAEFDEPEEDAALNHWMEQQETLTNALDACPE